MTTRVIVRWTETAKSQLAELPRKVRQGILAKARQLTETDDPAKVHKPLAGPLQNYYRLTYARYRAVYSVVREELANGDTLVNVFVTFIAVGKREERARNDIYRIAETLVSRGVVSLDMDDDTDD